MQQQFGTVEDDEWYLPYISCWGSEEPSQFPKALTKSLSKHIERDKTRLLDIGCGAGIIGIYCLIEYGAKSVTFTDLMPEWVAITKCNLNLKIRAGVIQESEVSVWKPRDLRETTADDVRQFDLLVFNPPQLPKAYVDEDAWQRIESNPTEKSFRTGGVDGLDIARLFFKWYASLGLSKPDAIIQLSSFLGRTLIEQEIYKAGLRMRGEPTAQDATLRPFLHMHAEQFSHSPLETSNRLIEKRGSVWHKKLLTYRLTSE